MPAGEPEAPVTPATTTVEPEGDPAQAAETTDTDNAADQENAS
jgi:hypothetical protein